MARRGVLSRQSPFSIVTSLLSLVLALVFVSDLVFGHPHMERRVVTMWLVIYVITAAIPLVCGRRFPRWAGIVTVVFIEGWSNYLLLSSRHVHAEINALLELPMIALYLGWFYPALLGRLFMVASVARNVVVLAVNPNLGHGVISPAITVGYAVLIAFFCFEGARAVRRRAHLQSIRDPLTGALNRRGLGQASVALRRRAARRGEPVSLAVIDFDDFTQINERGGHLAGDEALRRAVGSWQSLVGERGSAGPRGRRSWPHTGGLVSRHGGDEFVLLFRADVRFADDALRALLKESPDAWSWGTVALASESCLDDAIGWADHKLYAAKQRE